MCLSKVHSPEIVPSRSPHMADRTQGRREKARCNSVDGMFAWYTRGSGFWKLRVMGAYHPRPGKEEQEDLKFMVILLDYKASSR